MVLGIRYLNFAAYFAFASSTATPINPDLRNRLYQMVSDPLADIKEFQNLLYAVITDDLIQDDCDLPKTLDNSDFGKTRTTTSYLSEESAMPKVDVISGSNGSFEFEEAIDTIERFVWQAEQSLSSTTTTDGV